MPTKKQETITIDGKHYNLSDISSRAKEQIASIKFTDDQIQQLSNELAIADTARIGYTNALKSELNITTKTSNS